MKVCMVITGYFGQNVKNYFWKKNLIILSYKWNSKIKLLNDQVCSITQKVDLPTLSMKVH